MTAPPEQTRPDTIRLFLAGDVMTGRGVDQILPHPGDATLYEGYVHNAQDYVTLAERRCGPIPRALPFDYVWGDLPADLAARRCDLRLVNLETAITTAGTPAPKGINYRMHPANAPVLSAAGIDAVSLANNHTLDWGLPGLIETLDVLERQGIAAAGAGQIAEDAAAPRALPLPGGGRLLLLAFGATSSGIPDDWGATPTRAGINLLPGDSDAAVAAVHERLARHRRPGDLVVLSLHWGGNWGYDIPPRDRRLAQRMIKEAGVDILHGHSSHHPKAVEVHNGKLILYGAGDLINDYEGIAGCEAHRPDLVLGYVAEIEPATGALRTLEVLPYRLRAFRLQRTEAEDTAWLHGMLARECGQFGLGVMPTDAGALRLTWS